MGYCPLAVRQSKLPMKSLGAIILFTVATSVVATTWDEASVKDPISGKDTKVWEIVSFGGYILQWPSKYDAVYWPYTAEEHIRFSSESGYVAFGSDFGEITAKEKMRVSKFLSEHYDKEEPPTTYEEQLDWLERVYRARQAADEFWLQYHCVRAYLVRADERASLTHRKSALEIAERLEMKLKPGFERARVLFVLGSYSHMLGRNKKSEEYFRKLSNLKWETEDPEAKSSEDIVKYFSKLAEEIVSGRYRAEYLPEARAKGEQAGSDQPATVPESEPPSVENP